MDSVGTSTTTSFVIPNTLSTQTNWFSVRSRGPLSSVGRRANAIQKTPGVFACPIITGVESNSAISQNIGFIVFPNPGYGLYTLALSGLNNDDVSYKIFDISGKEIKNGDFGKQTGEFNSTINIEGVANGIYTLILNRGGVSNRQHQRCSEPGVLLSVERSPRRDRQRERRQDEGRGCV